MIVQTTVKKTEGLGYKELSEFLDEHFPFEVLIDEQKDELLISMEQSAMGMFNNLIKYYWKIDTHLPSKYLYVYPPE